MKNRFLTLITLMLIAGIMSSQNIVITDDDAYTANSSAMLDVKSLTKGLLIPRLTTAQRAAIVTPATGLLVFDTNINGFYYYNGSAWINLSSGSSGGIFWSYTSPNIYMTTATDKLGLGTSTPLHKIHLYESVAITDGTDGNFIDLQNSNNSFGVMSGIRFQNGTSANTFKGGIFYQDVDGYGTGNLIIANNTTEATGNVTASDGKLVFQRDGRIMVKGDPNSGLNTAIFAVQNSDGDTIFAVYPEGVRIWVNDDGGSKASGSRGGFAVGGFSPSKAGFTNEYLRVTPDSVRVYIDDDFIGSKAAGNRGGFAVGGFSPTKGTPTDHYLFVQDDSTRVFVNDSTAGFAIKSIEGTDDNQFLDLTTQNYFIGHHCGIANISGTYNAFMGYKAGLKNVSGYNNLFIGFNTGMNTVDGYNNLFIGNRSGYNNISGRWNVFVGRDAGFSHDHGWSNIFIGDEAGFYDHGGIKNTFIGDQSGYNNINGQGNVFLGAESGFNSNQSMNTFIGWAAGKSNVSGLQNVCVGAGSGSNQTSLGSSNVFIGYNAGYNETGSNRLYIENSNSSNSAALIYGEFDNNILVFNGNVGVSTLTPDNKLDVNGKISLTQSVGDEMVIINDDVWQHSSGNQDFGIGGDHFLMASRETASESAGIYGDGDHVTIWSPGDGAPGQAAAYLYILDEDLYNGTIDSDPFNNGAVKAYVTNAGVWQVSDVTKKQNIMKLNNAINKIQLLNGYTYEFKLNQSEIEKNQKAEVASGISAQELEHVLPEAVQTNASGDKFVNYSSVVPLLIEGIKEQQIIITDQQKQIDVLKDEINELKKLTINKQ